MRFPVIPELAEREVTIASHRLRWSTCARNNVVDWSFQIKRNLVSFCDEREPFFLLWVVTDFFWRDSRAQRLSVSYGDTTSPSMLWIIIITGYSFTGVCEILSWFRVTYLMPNTSFCDHPCQISVIPCGFQLFRNSFTSISCAFAKVKVI